MNALLFLVVSTIQTVISWLPSEALNREKLTLFRSRPPARSCSSPSPSAPEAAERVDLAGARDRLFEALDALPDGVRMVEQGEERHFDYPVAAYVQPRQCKLSRAGQVAGGLLLGVRGQYLMLDSGVFNAGPH